MYINYKIETPSGLPENIKAIIQLMETHDNNGEWWLYFDRMEDLDVNAKNAYVSGDISRKDWGAIKAKYIDHAIITAGEEE